MGVGRDSIRLDPKTMAPAAASAAWRAVRLRGGSVVALAAQVARAHARPTTPGEPRGRPARAGTVRYVANLNANQGPNALPSLHEYMLDELAAAVVADVLVEASRQQLQRAADL